MDPIVYQLTLYDEDGNMLSGSMSYSIQEGKAAPAAQQDLAAPLASALAQTSGSEMTLGTLRVAGTLYVPDLTDMSEYPIDGIMFFSLAGPTLATLFSGLESDTGIGIQFNLLDSPGQYIGGALSWYPDGFGSAFVPWCFLGTRE